MNKQLVLKRMAACVTLAMMFGGAVAQNATGSAATGSMAGNSSATAGAGAGGGGASASASKVASADQRMMRDIAHANISEIAAGKLALEKAQGDDVKAYAQKMIDDHTKAQQELQTLADSKGVKLPTEPDAKHKAMTKAMSALKGDAFDKSYLKQGGLKDHENTHKLLTRVQDKAKDADLKAYAAKTITAVDQHLTLAQETAGKHGMGNAKANMTGAATDNGTMGSRTGGMSSSGGSGAGAASSGTSGGRGTGAGAMGNGGSPAGTSAIGTTTPDAATGGTTGGASR